MPSGGNRPTAPQNQYAVSGTGGAGNKRTQPVRPTTGGPYGANKESVTQQSAAPMAAGPVSAGLPLEQNPNAPVVNPLHSADGVSGDPITHGTDFGRGAGSEVLPQGMGADTRSIENTQIIEQYLPALVQAMQSHDAPDSFKRFVNSLLKEVQNVSSTNVPVG